MNWFIHRMEQPINGMQTLMLLLRQLILRTALHLATVNGHKKAISKIKFYYGPVVAIMAAYQMSERVDR